MAFLSPVRVLSVGLRCEAESKTWDCGWGGYSDGFRPRNGAVVDSWRSARYSAIPSSILLVSIVVLVMFSAMATTAMTAFLVMLRLRIVVRPDALAHGLRMC